MAMQKEAEPVIRKLKLTALTKKNGKLPFKLFFGNLADMEIYLMVNGQDARHGIDLMGSQPATLATHYIAEGFSPDLIISAGTAGGLQSRGAEIGDIYLSNGPIRYHDRRYPMPDYREYGVGSYPSFDASSLGFKLGRVSSGDSLYMSTEESAQFEANEADVKDMEAAAVAWVASLHEIPFMAVKTITDLIDHPVKVEEQFVQNFEKAIGKLSDGLLELISQRLSKGSQRLA